ncbi:MAG: hypothetical protein R3180_00165 [Marinobacter sp.]|nr:hypothetical protein [Marinobacter sp.]
MNLTLIGGAIILALLGAVGWLMHDRSQLNERIGQLDHANQQLVQSAHEQAAENAALQSEIDKRDRVVQSAVRAREAAEANAQSIRRQLQEAIKNDPWSDGDLPAAVIDSLRKRSTPDNQNQN